MNANLMKLERAFTLIELMIVIAVVAVLTAIALPLYQEQVRKSARQQAKATMMQIAQLEERFYSGNNTYTTAIGTLVGIGGTTVYSGGKDFSDNVTSKHQINLAVGSGVGGCAAITCGYILTATLNGTYTDPRCVTLTLSSTGTRGFSGSGSAKDCW